MRRNSNPRPPLNAGSLFLKSNYCEIVNYFSFFTLFQKVLRKFHPKFFFWQLLQRVLATIFAVIKKNTSTGSIKSQFPSAIITNKKITIAEWGPFDKEKQLPLVNFGIIQFRNNTFNQLKKVYLCIR